MAYNAKVLADSISEAGDRLTTLEVTFPRMVLAEFNTHRMFSRNSASSRAIPVAKQLQMIEDDMFIPIYWGKNKSGMQASEELSGQDQDDAIATWVSAADDTLAHVRALLKLGVHKQTANRLLEPFMWHTVIVTATEWSNFFALRANPDAQPEIRHIAELMQQVMDESTPRLVHKGEWHLPLIQEDEMEWALANIDQAVKVSAARVGRTSYLTHGGVRDISEDLKLYERLREPGHMSPMEHPATPDWLQTNINGFSGKQPPQPIWHGNFRGWKQHRKFLPNEDDFSKMGA